MAQYLSSFESVFIDNRVDDVVLLDAVHEGDENIDVSRRKELRFGVNNKILCL
jgi:hypothetical protein